jgi:hypothetical protein
MYPMFLFLHSFWRWVVLMSLLCSVLIGLAGWVRGSVFTAFANGFRHWTATIAHIQLLLGMYLYFQSPVVRHAVPRDGVHVVTEHVYFRYIHIGLMFLAVIVITIGSAKAKRVGDDAGKFKTMFWWFLAGLVVLLVAIPWPFSPLASRPLLRSY